MKETNPIEIIKSKIIAIRPSVRWSFCAVIFSGLIIHFASMTQKYLNYFEMGNIFSHMPLVQGDTLSLGRWSLPFFTNIFTYYSMPVWNTIVCLIYIALSTAMIVELINLNSRAYGVLFGISFATFPGIVCVLSYGVNSDLFCVTLFLAVLAVFLLEKTKYGVIWGAIALALSIGSYQPYMSVSIAVIYCVLVAYVIDSNPSWKELILKAIKAVFMLALGFVLYYIILKIFISVMGISLSDYHGVDSMTSFTIKGIIKGIVYSYIYFVRYYLTTAYLYSIVVVVANVLVIVAVFALAIQVAKGNKTRLSQLLVMLVMLPIGIDASPVLMADRVGAGVDRYMIFSLVLVWALVCLMLERSCYEGVGRFAMWTALAGLIITAFASNIVDQKAYYSMYTSTRSVESMMNRVAARIEETPGWNKDMPVCLIGSREIINDNYEVTVPELESIENMPGTFYIGHYSDEAVEKYLKVFLHFPMELVPEEDREEILNKPEVKTMQKYPAEESIKIIDDILIVKFSEEE